MNEGALNEGALYDRAPYDGALNEGARTDGALNEGALNECEMYDLVLGVVLKDLLGSEAALNEDGAALIEPLPPPP